MSELEAVDCRAYNWPERTDSSPTLFGRLLSTTKMFIAQTHHLLH